MTSFVSLLIAFLALGVAVLSLHRHAVLANKVEMCVMVQNMHKHRLDKLEGKVDATLTDAEREAVEYFAVIDGPQFLSAANEHAGTLRRLLERLRT